MRGLLGAGLVVALPGLALAQAPAPAKNRFDLTLTAQASTDDNVLQEAGAVERQYLGDLAARLGYQHRSRRSWFRLAAYADAQTFAAQEELSRVGYGGEGVLSWALPRRTTLTLNQTYVSSYTRDIRALADAGLVLPLEVVNLAESTAQLERRLSYRWEAALDGTYQHIGFPSRRLADGEVLALAPSVRRRAGRTRWVSVTYLFQQGWAAGFDARAHGAVLGISHAPPRGFGYVVGGGAAYLEGARRTTPVGSAELSLGRRKGRVVARYDRRMRHALGLAREVVTDLVGLSVSRELSPSLTFTASGNVATNTDAADPTFRYRSDSYSGSLSWVMSRDITAGGGCSYSHHDPGTRDTAPSTRCSVSLAYRLMGR